MEETLGKRIVSHRKRLGMTQDKLAEVLGVTAQAVSKWENDQSCPDITMLPKLAEVFGTSTDALLGIPQQAALPAEVIAEDPDGDIHFHNGGDQWELKWDAGFKSGLGLALWVLLTGGLLLVSNILQWGAGLWDILWPSGLLLFGAFGLFPKFSCFRLGCVLFGGYFLMNNLLPGFFSLEKEYLLPVLLLLFGLSLLFDALRKKEDARVRVFRNGVPVHDSTNPKYSNTFSLDEETFTCCTSFGENAHSIDLPRLSGGQASVSFGELTVDLTGCEEISEQCSIGASCSFGELTLLVPRKWRAEPTSGTTLASVTVCGHPYPDAQGVLYLDCRAAFGEIQIRYV